MSTRKRKTTTTKAGAKPAPKVEETKTEEIVNEDVVIEEHEVKEAILIAEEEAPMAPEVFPEPIQEEPTPVKEVTKDVPFPDVTVEETPFHTHFLNWISAANGDSGVARTDEDIRQGNYTLFNAFQGLLKDHHGVEGIQNNIKWILNQVSENKDRAFSSSIVLAFLEFSDLDVAERELHRLVVVLFQDFSKAENPLALALETDWYHLKELSEDAGWVDVFRTMFNGKLNALKSSDPIN